MQWKFRGLRPHKALSSSPSSATWDPEGASSLDVRNKDIYFRDYVQITSEDNTWATWNEDSN